MAKAVEVSITSWRKNAVKAGEERGRVLLMPGTGYTCDRPLLYWAAQALVESGWRIDRMNVRNASDDLSAVTPVLDDAIDGWVTGVRAEAATAGRNEPRMLLIGKSLTTLTYPHVAMTHALPFVLLTPVLHHADFDPSRRVIPVTPVGEGDIVAESAESADSVESAAATRYPGPAPLICAGTADPFYDRALACTLTPHVHEYPDANHSIEVPGHWRRSLDYLKEVTASVAQYAAAL